ncbi:hypothetical protein [Dyadobacter sp. CY343]|uniref:hypothetical protein n=1 Tax=Dyadobacter sp. CY343 TaxID=2907299 RepID=UPI001F3A8385|nr:hypothetical protein [Dyadobacter sp. CY343]MCE7061272.1 hypothetical protein [Dyadobacter sp. CY343]
MKKNVPKFLIARNEAAKPGVTYIVHTQEPAFVGEIVRFSSLTERRLYQEENQAKEIIQVTPTTLLVVQNYLESGDKTKRREFLDKQVVHWIVANYINFDAFGKENE